MVQKPLILLAGTERSQLRTLHPFFTAAGFDVATATDEPSLVDLAQTRHPHVIMFDVGLAPPGYGLARTLRTDPALSPATPIILTGPGRPTRSQQLEAWHAGAWDVCQEPLELDELLARLRLFVDARVELDRISSECLVDRTTGLYNPEGLARRAAELAALVTRHGLALSCAVFQPTAKVSPAASERLALAVRRAGRMSDAIGRTGQSEFAVFAAGTTTWSAARLVRRMTDSVTREFSTLEADPAAKKLSLRSGYSAAQARHKISPTTLLSKARGVLRES